MDLKIPIFLFFNLFEAGIFMRIFAVFIWLGHHDQMVETTTGFVRQKSGRKVPSFNKQKEASSFLSNEPDTDLFKYSRSLSHLLA
jgi:hypothetical protein